VKRYDPQMAMWRRAKARAKRRGIPFQIAPADIHIPFRCPILALRLRPGNRDTAPSLDRIDSRKGYVRGNIQVISNRANRLKSDANLEEVMRLAIFLYLLELNNGKRR
jgi:hypothetical protein